MSKKNTTLGDAYDMYMNGTPISIDMDRDGNYQRVGSMTITDQGYAIVNNEYRRPESDVHDVKIGRSR